MLFWSPIQVIHKGLPLQPSIFKVRPIGWTHTVPSPIKAIHYVVQQWSIWGLKNSGVFHWLVVPWFLCMELMTENPKTFQVAVQSALAELNLQKRFTYSQMTMITQKPKLRNQWDGSHKTSEKMFLCHKGDI